MGPPGKVASVLNWFSAFKKSRVPLLVYYQLRLYSKLNSTIIEQPETNLELWRHSSPNHLIIWKPEAQEEQRSPWWPPALLSVVRATLADSVPTAYLELQGFRVVVKGFRATSCQSTSGPPPSVQNTLYLDMRVASNCHVWHIGICQMDIIYGNWIYGIYFKVIKSPISAC